MSASVAARAVADAQLIAYNGRDMEAYLALFHEDAMLVNLPDQSVIAQGLDAIRAMYETRFATPGLRCVVHEKSEIGAIAIDRETVYTDGLEGRIKRIFFVRGGEIAS